MFKTAHRVFIFNFSDLALSQSAPQGLCRSKYAFAAMLMTIFSCFGSVSAQTVFPSYAYIVGQNPRINFAGTGKTVGADGQLSILIAFFHRNLSASLPKGSGYYVKSMKIYHPTLPGYRWDTIPNDTAPLLIVTRDRGREILNHPDGSIDGLNLATEGRLDLFITDPTLRTTGKLTGLILEMVTTDGTIKVPIASSSFFEHQY